MEDESESKTKARVLFFFFFCLSSLNFQPRVLILSVPVVASISSISVPNSPRV